MFYIFPSKPGDEIKPFQLKGDFNKVDELPPEVLRRVKALKNIQLSNIKHEVEYYKELHQLDLKYQKIYDENNLKRKQIYLGEYEPSDLECEWVDKDGDEEDVSKDFAKLKVKPSKDSVKGIPDFWLTVFQNANEGVLHGTIEAIDEPILKYLEDVTVALPETNDGFTINFHFAPNDFFTNSVLFKEYKLRNDYDREDPLDFDGPEVIKSISCKIDWKSGKNPGIKIIKQKVKPKGKGKGGPKMVTKEEKRDTFFNYFKSHEKTNNVDDDDEELAMLNEDFDIGINIKEKLIPKAVLYFTGEADDSLDLDDEEFDDEDDDLEDDD